MAKNNLQIYAWARNNKGSWVKYDGVLVDEDGIVYIETPHNGLRPLKVPYRVHIDYIDNDGKKCNLCRDIE